MTQKQRTFKAVLKQDEDWWIGWIKEVPGVNCQEKTKSESQESLKEAIGFNTERQGPKIQ